MKLLYVANIRLPTEKAHGLQIVQNCEAFADAGADVTLWVARRINTPELRSVRDIWAHYGVKRNFSLRRLPCIDLLALVPNRTDALARLIFMLQLWTFALAALVGALYTRADVIYSRDELILLLLSLIKPRAMLAYEAHTLAQGRGGQALQRRVVRRVGSVFAVTRRLADDLVALGADAEQVHVAHDGIRAERFANLPDQTSARQAVGWSGDAMPGDAVPGDAVPGDAVPGDAVPGDAVPGDAVSGEPFIVGYVGRLQTMAMDKGVGTLVEALAKVGDCTLALVGGPDETAAEFRQRWIELGQDAAHFLYAGQVSPERVPSYLVAFDVCAMPFPWTIHFAYYASPIKLFEYMASRRPLVASNLPSVVEVVTDGESALLTSPGDVDALADAIRRLRDDPALRQRLADNACALVMERYTWDARAEAILNVLRARA